jgi:signal transduction histidine kinase
VDKLNSLSYAYHYRNLDSTALFARQAYDASAGYREGRAASLNNLAFVNLARMQYETAKEQLDSIAELTDNQLELLVSYIQQMRLCQRRSANREFYDYRELALKALGRINEERLSLSAAEETRLRYAESELAIVTSTYFYYVGLERQSVDALMQAGNDVELDTAQWMNYLYNMGAGGIITQGTPIEIEQKEFSCLLQCYLLAQAYGSPFFTANAQEAIADHLASEESRWRLVRNNPMAFDVLNRDLVVEDSLAVYLAQQSLAGFSTFGDVYQIAGAHRTLASCYRACGNYTQALAHLEAALADSVILQAPDLVASICEQLSVAYSAIDDKPLSDLNRNRYLDLQEQTRQDRSLEARAGQLDAAVAQLNMLLLAVLAALLLLIVALTMLYRHYRKSQPSDERDELSQQREELEEALTMNQMKLRQAERRNLDQRAKLSLVAGITPLIDRMLHDVRRIAPGMPHADEHLQYVSELTDTINDQNDVLTHWIQLRKGELSLHVETFSLQSLFDIIEKSRRSFTLKGITLHVEPTQAKVKADRVLTLFMLNTLADNARKFTGEGGEVTVSATVTDRYVEISVADTGRGLDEDELARVFDHKVSGGHGFGLLNCRGIIEKYRKTSQLFGVCLLSVESTKGKSSRFYFRLPVPPTAPAPRSSRSAVAMMALLLGISHTLPLSANPSPELLLQASAFADSAYTSNINGTFERTLLFADSCFSTLNTFYLQEHPRAVDTLQLFSPSSLAVTEIGWLHRDLPVNYNTLLLVRNESAVAALALHDWQLYQYNNRIYTLLFKELSADRHLDDYCRRMQQSQSDRMVAVILLMLIMLSLLLAITFQIVHVWGKRAQRMQQQQSDLEILSDEVRRLELEEARLHISNQVMENSLSALKHETMYYPSRIRQLIATGDTAALPEVVSYYRELYGILSQQAGSQAGIHLHLKPLSHDILGDENLIAYLFDLLRQQAKQKALIIDYTSAGDCVVCTVDMPGVPVTSFMPSIDNIPYLICRQIVREHGEATGRRACGMRSEATPEGSRIIITLPKTK